MDIQSFSQLGIGLATLLILWFVVKYFIEATNKKDAYIKELVTSFNITINNHIDHSIKQSAKETTVLNSLVKAINSLVKSMGKNH